MSALMVRRLPFYSAHFNSRLTNNSTSLSLACCKQVHCCHVKGQQSKQASNQKAVLDSCQLSLEVSSTEWELPRDRAQATLPSYTTLLPT